MIFDILTIFPGMMEAMFADSIIAKAKNAGKVEINIHDLRKWTSDARRTVDDRPFGGGAGMLMMVEPIYKALKDLGVYPILRPSPEFGVTQGDMTEKLQPITDDNLPHPISNHIQPHQPHQPISADFNPFQPTSTHIVLTSAGGQTWNQQLAQQYSQQYERIVIIAGHYEGVDHRVVEHLVDSEISIGNYVLTGGEMPAGIIVDSISRLLPGVLGNPASLTEESHNSLTTYNLQPTTTNDRTADTEHRTPATEYPQYTRPAAFITDEGETWGVPEVLLSGNHANIKKWREEQINQ